MELDTETIEEAVFDGSTLPVETEGPNGSNPWETVDRRTEGEASFDTLLVTDSGDSDGLGCAALLSHKFNSLAVLPSGNRGWGYEPLDVLKRIRNTVSGKTEIYITDLGQTEDNKIEWMNEIVKLTNDGHKIHIRDHHENPQDLIDAINELDNADYIHDPDICATKNVLKNDYPDAPEHLQTLAEYTNVRDLFLTEDERFQKSEILSNAAFWFPVEKYVDMASSHGIELMNDPEWGSYIENRSQIKREKLTTAMDTKEFYEKYGADWGFIYGDCYHSEAGRRLLEEHDCDTAVIVKPSGKLSFRTTEDYPMANKIASKFGGGGHDCAAGANPDDFSQLNLWENDPIREIREKIFEQSKEILE